MCYKTDTRNIKEKKYMSNHKNEIHEKIVKESERKEEEIQKFSEMMKMMNGKTRPIRIPESTLLMLEKEADKHKLTLSKYINLLLILHLTSPINNILQEFQIGKSDQ